jgi:hypothetical protein
VDGVEEHVQPGESFVDDTTYGVANDDTSIDVVPVEEKALTQSEDFLVEKMQTIIYFSWIWASLLIVQYSHHGIQLTSRAIVAGGETKSTGRRTQNTEVTNLKRWNLLGSEKGDGSKGDNIW